MFQKIYGKISLSNNEIQKYDLKINVASSGVN